MTRRLLGAASGAFAWHVLARRRRRGDDRLRAAFPELDAAARRRCLRQAFRRVPAAEGDTVAVARLPPVALCRRLRLEGWEHLVEAERHGRGVIVLLAHLGPWQLAAWAVGLYRDGLCLAAPSEALDPARLDCFGVRLLPRRDTAREAEKILSQGGRVGCFPDAPAAPDEGVHVPFLGRDTTVDRLPARLALAGGAPAVAIFVHPEPKGVYRVVAYPPIAAEGADAAVLTRRLLEPLEGAVRQRPELWPWWR